MVAQQREGDEEAEDREHDHQLDECEAPINDSSAANPVHGRLGAAAGMLLLALRLRTRKDMIPFGPAMAAGAMIAVFGPDAIVH